MQVQGFSALKRIAAVSFYLMVSFHGCKNSVNIATNPPDQKNDSGDGNQSSLASCGNIESGVNETRIRFQHAIVPHGQSCLSESQTRTCVNGSFTAWTGSFPELECVVSSNPDLDNDGILNASDNCPAQSNNDQKDIDNNGRGDVCDEKYNNVFSALFGE